MPAAFGHHRVGLRHFYTDLPEVFREAYREVCPVHCDRDQVAGAVMIVLEKRSVRPQGGVMHSACVMFGLSSVPLVYKK